MLTGRKMRRCGWFCLPVVGLAGCVGDLHPHHGPAFLERRSPPPLARMASVPPRQAASPFPKEPEPPPLAELPLQPTADRETASSLSQADALSAAETPLGKTEGSSGAERADAARPEAGGPPRSASDGPPRSASDSGASLPPPAVPLPEAAPLPAAPLTLDQIIHATLWADPFLRAGFESIPQAQADALTASLLPNPQLIISQTLLPLTRPFTPDKEGGPPQLDVGIRYPIDWFLFGKRVAALQSAALGVRVAEAEFANVVRQRVLEAALRYYDLLEAKALVELAAQDVENLRRIEEITAKAVAGGGRPRVELQRVQLDRLRAEQGLREAEKNRVAAAARLRAVLGQSAADPAFDVAGDIREVSIPVLPSAEEAYALAVEERPDLAALRLRVQQAEANQLVEQRKAWPDVTPFLGYTRQFQRRAMAMPDASSFGFGLEASLPVFDRNQGNRLKAQSVTAQSQYQLQAALAGLRAEVEQAAQEVRTAAANARTVAEEQLKLAAEVRDSIARAYEAGGRPLLDVLDAQRNYRETYRLYITSRAALARAIAQFNAAVNRRLLP
ncbi:TolC family protein [Thermogemmata fonticola]|uniref:TolC family protein n=1 Tax=Thermogemmata fonticola TaxID=2755323 RepID=A0A7V9ACE7_9BACT|nr:TolC family protein [Thermogemmata fonticola]MBA2226958.1 TolC family protein [Thermogemmata fonticola]